MYTLIKNENIKNIGSGFIYEHLKTGAKIIYIKNNDKNKCFSISFKTLPKDNTGVPHIIEHCVLCGSEKYRLKEPFNHLDKSTLNTYLNAITFSDKTLYPICSMNNQDFFKLIDVYLNAVFFPLIYEKQGIFLQEGWNFNEKEINGVVFNEMQGVYSSPDALIDFKVKKALFDNGYNFNSGGFPPEITNLEYNDFLNFHKIHYNPTNSIIYFYGDLDIDYYLDYLDTEYLSKFEKADEQIISKSNDFSHKIFIEDYYYSDEENSDKNYFQATFKLNFNLQPEKCIFFEVIANILIENQEGILKKAFIESGFCDDVTCYLDDDMLEPVFTIQIEGAKEKNLNKYKDIIEKTINNLELSEEIIKSNFLPIEFYLKEADFGSEPKGLFYNIVLLKSILYGKFDFSYLKFEEVIDNAKNVDYINILKENLVENKNAVYCILKPKNNTEKKVLNLKDNTEELLKYQNEEDTQEELKKLAPLHINEIEKSIIKLNTKINKNKNTPVIFNCIETEIVYLNFVFDISEFGNNQYLNLFNYLIDKVGTKNINPFEMETKLKSIFGEYNNFIGCYDLENGEFLPSLTLTFRMFERNIENAFFLIQDIFLNLSFLNSKRLINLIKELLSKIEFGYLKDSRGDSILRAKSYLSKKHNFSDKTKGVDFYFWLKELVQNIDQNIDEITLNLENIAKCVFDNKKLYIAVTCNEKNYLNVEKYLSDLTFSNHNIYEFKENYRGNIFENEAFIIPSDINYNSKAFIIKNFKLNGSIYVLKKIIDTEYIWQKIRTEGGAYGGKMYFARDGIFCFNSYSDPNILKTYDNFENISNYIKYLNLDENTLHRYKIGTINDFDREIKNNEINHISLYRYFLNLTEDDILNEKNQIINVKVNEIKDYFYILKEGFENSKICTIGNKKNIEKNIDIFNNIKKLIY